MIPTYLSLALVRPGLYMEDGRPPHISELELWDESNSGGFSFIDNESKAIYSLTRDKIITLEEIKFDENNYLIETLVIPRSIQGISFDCDFHDFSSTNWLDDGDNFDMLFCQENMVEIAKIVMNHYDHEFKRANYNPSRHKYWLESKIFNCSFIALWDTHSSQGYEDLYPELDFIEFLGEGYVELNKE